MFQGYIFNISYTYKVFCLLARKKVVTHVLKTHVVFDQNSTSSKKSRSGYNVIYMGIKEFFKAENAFILLIYLILNHIRINLKKNTMLTIILFC